MSQHGYIVVPIKNHPRSSKEGYIKECVLIAEKALGKYLPSNAIIHHLDGNPSNDQNNNLVICGNQAYHSFIHQRKRAKDACGNVHWRKCIKCREYDASENLHPKIHLAGKKASPIFKVVKKKETRTSPGKFLLPDRNHMLRRRA